MSSPRAKPTGRVILVTGCRSGFGLRFARDLAARGHTVFAGLRDLSTQGALVEATEGLAVHPVQLDVTVEAERRAVVEHMLAEHGRIDALINNAGVALGGFLEQVDADELQRVFSVNVFAVHALTNLVLPSMRERRAGKVVNISSMSGFMAFPGLGTYAASKFALEGLSEAWRHELALFGIDVYLVEPGAFRTDIWTRNRALCRRGYDPDSPYAPYVAKLDANFENLVDQRVRDPQPVSDLVVRLVEGRRQRLRHPIGPGTVERNLVKRFLPFAVVERVVKRLLMRDL